MTNFQIALLAAVAVSTEGCERWLWSAGEYLRKAATLSKTPQQARFLAQSLRIVGKGTTLDAHGWAADKLLALTDLIEKELSFQQKKQLESERSM